MTALSAWQWRVLVTTPLVLLQTWQRLRSGGYVRALAAVQPVRRSSLTPAAQLVLARDTAYALAVAVKYGPWRPRCLLRSLALGWFLARQGIAFKLHIGVPGKRPVLAPPGPLDFSAHAWVECLGVVLNDRADIAAEYRPFDV